MNIDQNAVLRLRICGHADCRAVFTICVRCDRGQRYCGPKCRSEVRRRQRYDANRRYQQSEPGRESHRRCQKRYRDRGLRPPVTDHGAAAITPPAPPQPPTMCQCVICGRHSLWIDPFPAIPRRYRSARRSKNHVFRRSLTPLSNGACSRLGHGPRCRKVGCSCCRCGATVSRFCTGFEEAASVDGGQGEDSSSKRRS